MKVIICGAGQVGYGIAERLASEQNDVSVIDSAAHLIDSITDTLDVRGFVGHGAHPDVLAQAGADDADMIVAVTLYDEVNMVACQVAHSLFSIPTKVARIRSQNYLETQWADLFTRDHLPIDVTISPEVEVGEMVMRRLALPGAFDTVSFADGEVVVLGISCEEDCPVVDTPLNQLTDLFPDFQAVVTGISRDGHVFVPRSEDAMLVHDEVYLVAKKEQVARAFTLFGHDEKQASRVVIAGGGNIGLYVARQLEHMKSRARVKVIEADRQRAIEIADQLDRTVVLHGSALDEDILREAGIGEADTMLSITNDDKVNVLSSVMAKRLGCARSLCLVNDRRYPALARSLGIDSYLNPRAITISKILQHVRRGRIRGVHAVENGKAEVLEAEALPTSPLVGKPLRELDILDDGIRIGAVYRNGQVSIPRGDTVIAAGDRVVVFSLAEQVRHVEQMFRVSLEFF
ncbi:MAG: Trk system potassium transporter TrkA [Pseudomonadota bacterium]